MRPSPRARGQPQAYEGTFGKPPLEEQQIASVAAPELYDSGPVPRIPGGDGAQPVQHPVSDRPQAAPDHAAIDEDEAGVIGGKARVLIPVEPFYPIEEAPARGIVTRAYARWRAV